MKSIGVSIVTGLAAGAAAAAAIYIFPLALLLMPALIASAGVLGGACGLITAAASSAFGAVLLTGGVDTFTVGLMLMFIPGGVVIGYCLMHKLPYRTAAVAAAVLAALGIYTMTCVPSLLAGKQPFAYYTEAIAAFGDAAESAAASMGLSAERTEALIKQTAYMQYRAPDTAAMMMCCFGMASGLLSTVIARAICKGKAELRPMAPFHLWQLSRGFVGGSMILLLGAILLPIIGVKNASAAAAAIECIVAGPYALMGICLMAFTVKMKVRSRGKTVLSVVLTAILTILYPLGLSMIGASDALLRVRSVYMQRKNKKK